MKLLLMTYFACVQAAFLQCWNYYVKDDVKEPFNVLGDARTIDSLGLVHLHFENSPGLTLALINEQSFAKTNSHVFQAVFKVEASRLDAYFNAYVSGLGEGRQNSPSLIGFAKQLVANEGILTFILRDETPVERIESWFDRKCFSLSKDLVDSVFQTQYRDTKLGSKWRVALDDPAAGPKILFESYHLGQLFHSMKFSFLKLAQARLVVEHSEFALSQSHDRFEITLDNTYRQNLFWFAICILRDSCEMFGEKPWMGLEKALRLDMVEVSPKLSKLCLYFGMNSVNKNDIQRVFSGYPYSALIEENFFQPQRRKIPSFQIESLHGYQVDLHTSAFIDGDNGKGPSFTFPNITAKKLQDPSHSLHIRLNEAISPGDKASISYFYSCSNLPAFITRFWLDFINNKSLPDFVGLISYFKFERMENSPQNALLIQLPKDYATPSTLQSLEILVYLFFRYCGIESSSPWRILSLNSIEGAEVLVGNLSLSNVPFRMHNYTMKWFNVKVSSADDWIPPAIHKHLKKRGGAKRVTSGSARTESEVHVPVAVPTPLVFPRPIAPPPPPIENNVSWDQFFSELED